MKFKLAVTALALGISMQVGAKDDWIEIASSDKSSHSVKVGTLELVTNKAGEAVVVAVGRVQYSDKTVDISKWYVRTADCDAGYGKLVTLSTDGSFLFDNDFATGGGSVGSAKAEALCTFYKAVKLERERKSI